jgi:hypothetical protein
MRQISHIITDHNITVNFEGQTHIIPRNDPLADQLIQALRENRIHDIPNLISIAKRIEKLGQGDFTVQDDQILIKGQVAPAVLGRKIVRFANEGLPHLPLVHFAENLLQNPSFRAVQELFQFLEKNDHPITEDGCFIAYKKVQENFLDYHSGTFDNSPGKTPEVPRNQVNEDPNQACAEGLHVANFDYASHFQGNENGKMIEVKVNPADVVSVPFDYNFSKIRACRYEVLGEVDREHSEKISLRVMSNDVVSDQDDEPIEICQKCGSEDHSDEECELENHCDYCDRADCECDFIYFDTKKEKDECSSCGGDHINPKEDQYPWESELDD